MLLSKEPVLQNLTACRTGHTVKLNDRTLVLADNIGKTESTPLCMHSNIFSFVCILLLYFLLFILQSDRAGRTQFVCVCD